MAKFKHSYSVKGIFDFESMTVTEITKDGQFVYGLEEFLESVNGKEISVTIAEEQMPEPIESY